MYDGAGYARHLFDIRTTALLRVLMDQGIYMSMLAEPQDDIDPRLMEATDKLFASLVGDFTLGGQARYIDVFGSEGESLRADPGYISQDGKIFRVMTIAVPVILNDVHEEVA
jgi:hypothetical protein